MKGRTAILKEYFKPMELLEYTVPDPEPGAVLVKMTMAGLCGSDLHTWRGDQIKRPLPPTGRPMGHEGVGVISALGAGVEADFSGKRVREGDRVVFSAVFSCNRCLACLSGDHNLCDQFRLNYRSAGDQHPYFVNTYADFDYLPPGHAFFKVPDELSDESVVSLNCAMGTVLQGLDSVQVRQGQTVVIQGVGGLGQYAVAFAKDLGASQIIAIDGQAPRLELSKEFGATATINVSELDTPEARIQRVAELGNGGADLVVELVGLGELMPEGISMLKPGGAFLEIGNLMAGRTATIEPVALIRRKRIVGSAMYRPSILPRILDFLVRNKNQMPFDKIISHKFSLEGINEAFEQAEWVGRSTPVIRGAIVP